MTVRPSTDPTLDAHDLRAIIDSSLDCIKVLDLEAHLLSMNAGGLTAMDLNDFSVCRHVLWPSFWEGQAREHVERALEAARAGHTTTFEGPARTFAGTLKWWEVQVSPLRAPDGTVTRLLAVSRDITARREAERQVEEAQRLLQDHAQRLEARVGQHEQALAAFVRFTTEVATSTDLDTLASAAGTIIQDAVAGTVSGFYLVRGDRAYPLVFSSRTPPQAVETRQAGLSLAAPVIQEALARHGTAFVDGDEARRQATGYAAALSVTAYHLNGQPFALFRTGTEHAGWTDQEKAIIESVGRGLGLALERAQQTRQLQERTAGLDAFVAFTETVGSEIGTRRLAQQAIDVIGAHLEVVNAAYYERDGTQWREAARSPDSHPDVAAQRPRDLPSDAPEFAEAMRAGTVVFSNVVTDDQRSPSVTGRDAATAFSPVVVDGAVTGILAVEKPAGQGWTRQEQAIVRAVGQGLGLALNRAAQARRLDEERAALEAFTRFTESVGSETDVNALVQRAITLLADTCEVDAAYFERDGDLFRATAVNARFDGTLLPLLQRGFPLQHSGIARVLRRNAAAFIDHWNDTDLLIQETGIYRALAGYPYLQHGELESVLIIGSRTSATWAERHRGVFRAVGHSLDLALDRARQTRTIAAQRDALDARTQELTASTEELEAFSHSVSHDLRTPVRHMLGFLHLARTTLDGRLDERSARYLNLIEQAGGQMTVLIDALLDLSRTAQQPLRMTSVDLNEIMAQLQENVLPDLLTRHVQWTVGPLPTVWGDRDALKQVMTQLTENALKFTRSRDPAVIHVWAEQHDESWSVFVRDNGLGFDPRYTDRLFRMFQRLHTVQETTGTGVGLASVRRLILKHGGRVSAEGRVGQGATFGFTLPRSTAGQL